jgi:hypothetical protein
MRSRSVSGAYVFDSVVLLTVDHTGTVLQSLEHHQMMARQMWRCAL